MLKKFLSSLLFAAVLFGAEAADYGLPSGIQEGNILHCFNWPASDVKAALPQIAAAGFGSVQISPCQRGDVKAGSPWHDLYRPYDLAFKSSSYCSEQDLKDLCSEAAKYGIKVIVDVVANHVDKTAGYHDSWWDSNGRVRWNGGINYGDRFSITHGQLGDYGDINSEDSEVIARAKSYVEKLKSLGVKGIRWDAAKHIGLPSEGCNFWSSVTSVPGVWHYGEILDNPGPNPSIIKEYTNFMSVTDNEYCNYAARDNGGIPGGYAGSWVVNQGCPDTKMVYWAESHDTYANDDWSKDRDQATIDRAYAAYASRNGAAALYLSRPNTSGFSNIKVGKGSTAFTSKHISEVNKFRNLMVGHADWFEASGNACSITRKDGGAVIVMKGSGNVSITNGGGYCPAGTYTDRVSGGTFTVTASTISGNVGSSGIAVLIANGVTPITPDNPDNPVTPDDPITPDDPTGSMYILGNIDGAQWTTNNGAEMKAQNGSYVARNVKFTKAAGETKCYFNITDALAADWDALNMIANRYGAATEGDPVTLGQAARVVKYANGVDASGCLSWTISEGSYDLTFNPSAMTLTVVAAGSEPVTPDDPVNPGDEHYIYFDGTSFNQPQVWAWTSSANCNANSTWGGDNMVKKGNLWYWALPEGKPVPEQVIIHEGDNKIGGGDLKYVDKATYHQDGTYTEASNPPTPGKPVVTANPASGTTFSSSLTVTLSVSPAATIYYSLNGTATTSSSRYTDAILLTETTTISTLAVAADGTQNAQSFSYTKRGSGPTPPAPAGNNLITDYYKVNPDGHTGRNRTVNMVFDGHSATNALSNWTEEDLIAQGVARDVCQAFKGLHERPIIDSYALYASYDSQNLYLGVQFVYTVWDLYGEGKQPGESKPHNGDMHMCWAFDLDPQKSFDGYIGGKGPIWNDTQKGAKFNNGVDAVLMCSTKPGAGTPGFFTPTPDGHASYDAAYCGSLPSGSYGYAAGLLPSITHIWGQPFGADPDALKGNEGFVDLRSEVDDDAHTFYEFKIPLSLLGVTEQYIRDYGIGVMYLDKYGSSPIGGTPYDPAYFDNVNGSYSQDSSSSEEKEDEDVITYSPARVGGNLGNGIGSISAAAPSSETPVYYDMQGIRVDNPSGGIYIVVRGNHVSKEYVR